MAFVNLMSDLFGGLGQGFNTYNALNQQELEKRARQQQIQEQQRQFDESQNLRQAQLDQQMKIANMEDLYRNAALKTEWNTREKIAEQQGEDRKAAAIARREDIAARKAETKEYINSQKVDKLSTDYLTAVDEVNSIVRDTHSKAMQMIEAGQKEITAEGGGGAKLPSNKKEKSRERELAEWYNEQVKKGNVSAGNSKFTQELMTKMGVDANIRKARQRKDIAERLLGRYGGVPGELSGYGQGGWWEKGEQSNVDVSDAINNAMGNSNNHMTLTPSGLGYMGNPDPQYQQFQRENQRERDAKDRLWELINNPRT